MKHFYYLFKVLFFVHLLSSLVPPFSHAAYSDTILVPVEEVWTATLEALDPYGIRKKDFEKGKLESGWHQDRVVRSHGLLKKVFRQTYERRSRFEIRFKEEGAGAAVEIRGKFQERPAGSPQAVWRTVKPESQDYELERELFQKILTKIEAKRLSHGKI